MSTYPAPTGGWSPRPGYRRSAYPGLPAEKRTRPSDWTAQPTAGRRRGVVATSWVAGLGGVGLVAMLVYIALSSDQEFSMRDVVLLAALPVALVLATVRWIDRWEPEPISIQTAAFLWGAGVATVVSLVLNTSSSLVVAFLTGSSVGVESFGQVVSAPIVEEATKGLGVLIIFLIWRRSFNGPVDGIVYAMVVATGFAFAENILYFARFYDSLVETFFLRAVMSPFAHPTFTAFTGLAIGASARMRSSLAWVWTTPVGLVCAIILHALWNGVITEAPQLYFLAALPFFVAWIGAVAWLRWNERMTIRARLSDYQRAGWFGPAEIMMLTTHTGRSSAMRWARKRGPAATAAMKTFVKSSSALAQLRQQALDGHAEKDFAAREEELLQTVSSSRRTFTGRN